MKNTGRFLALAIVNLAFVIPATGFAQSSSEPEPGENIEEIIVYSRFDAESSMEIPQTVDTFGEEFLEDIGAQSIGDALRFVPGASRDGSKLDAFGDDYLIRGFSASETVNGTSVSHLRQARDSVNVERIEVLKGPASVLYGSMEPGAVVNIVTKQPLDHFHLDGSLEAARYDAYRGTIDVGGPLTDAGTLNFRFNAAYENSDAFIDFWNREHLFIAPVIAYSPGERTTITLESVYVRDDWAAFYNGIPAQGTVLPNPNGPIPRNRHYADPALDGTLREGTEVSLRLEHELTDAMAFRAALVWTNNQQDYEEVFGLLGFADEALRNLLRVELDTVSDEDIYAFYFDLSSSFDTGALQHELVVGGEYSTADFSSDDHAFLIPELDLYDPTYFVTEKPPNLFDVFDSTSDQEDDSYGIFLQDRIPLGDNVNVIGGVRYSRVEQKGIFSDFGGPASITEQTDSEWTSQLGIVWFPVEDVALFANHTTSFLPIGGTAFGGSPLDPETGDQVEIGVKSYIGGGLTANLAYYHVTRDNVAVADRDNPGFEIQLGEETVQGFEASLSGELADNWMLYAGYAYADSEVSEDTDPTRIGIPIRNVPKNTFALQSQYGFTSGLLEGLQLGGNVNFVDERAGDINDSFRLPSHWQVDASALYRLTDSLELRFSVENLTDEDFYTVAWSEAEVWPAAPRTWRLGVRFTL
ncbi:MAG TPA: TonB-dependent siderophore receptor [Woeseiaceae bacterium]|nr:TonB-dependent siderophore receptor [Woeseiaceae bacterium]